MGGAVGHGVAFAWLVMARGYEEGGTLRTRELIDMLLLPIR